MRRLPARRALLASALLLLLGSVAAAQPTTSSITGRTRDASGGALGGVRVTALHLETGLQREAESGACGEFVLPSVPVGAYEGRAALAGFRQLVQGGIVVVLGEPAVLTLRLEVGGAAEITVLGDVSAVQSRGGQLSYLVSEEAVADLPLNGRNYTDLAFLQPGVLSFPHRDGGSIVAHGLAASINGQDPRSNVYLLDGTLLNDFTQHAPLSTVVPTFKSFGFSDEAAQLFEEMYTSFSTGAVGYETPDKLVRGTITLSEALRGMV